MKKFIIIILLIVLVGGGVRLFKKRQADLTKTPVAAVLPVVVENMQLTRGSVTLTLPAMGVVSSDLSATLSTKVSGRITGVYKQEGDRVKKGEKLANIEAEDLLAKKAGLRSKMEGIDFQISAERENIGALQTSLASARETHARTLELLAVKGASPEQSRQEESGIATIQAKISAAENGIATQEKSKETLVQNIREIDAMLDYAVITSPIDGTVSARLAMPGDLATPGKALFRIAARSGLSVNLSLPGSLRPAGLLWDGKELALAAKNEASAAGLAQYLAPLPDDAGLVEGQFLNVRVVVYRGEDTLVPVDGLLSVGGESFVFVYEEGRPIKTRVEIVARGGEGLVVRPELAGKTILLAKPDILLRAAAGAPVLLQGHGSAALKGPEPNGGQNNG